MRYIKRPILRRYNGPLLSRRNTLMNLKSKSYSTNTYKKTKRSRRRSSTPSYVNSVPSLPLPPRSGKPRPPPMDPPGDYWSSSNASNQDNLINALSSGWRKARTPSGIPVRPFSTSSANSRNLNQAISNFSRSVRPSLIPRYPRRNRKPFVPHNVPSFS